MKIVINRCYGGFGLSKDAIDLLQMKKGAGRIGDMFIDRNGDEVDLLYPPRDDKDLVEVVEELGGEASGGCADLKIVEVPDDVKWHIEEYDGLEHVAEVHRTWC